MDAVGFNRGDVLWIDPAVYRVPELPSGFAFLVQEPLRWGELRRAMWVRGMLIDGHGTPVHALTLCVPTNQPRAVPANQRPTRTPPLPARAVSAGEPGRHRVGDDPGLVGPPPGYERRVFR
jgi:hypothetical protein